jgi:hypothetical protein
MTVQAKTHQIVDQIVTAADRREENTDIFCAMLVWAIELALHGVPA